jgi:FAD:protein FMN transferase
MKPAMLIHFLVVAVSILAISRLEPAAQAAKGSAMGTSWTLAWRGRSQADLALETAKVLEHWEQVLSQWREDSDLSRHNQGEPASAELTRVILLAESVSLASGGALDPRLLEKVHAAGFGPPGRGYDLSSIGKGFAVDRVGERLRQLGVKDFVFELGGEVLAGDGEWRVEIERPQPGVGKTLRHVALRNQGLATSGNYRQFRPGPTGLISHLIDPRSGEPVERAACSVTVIAGDCATADAWATALFILGPEFSEVPAGIEVTWQE